MSEQLYLDDGLRQYVYWIVVSNSKRSSTRSARSTLRASSKGWRVQRGIDPPG